MLQANTNYFDTIDTEAKAYILGYILADGCVNSNRLIVSSIDKDRIDFIKQELESEHKIGIRDNKGGFDNAKPIYSLTIGRKNVWNSLYQYKTDSNNIQIPNIDSDLICHFIRGFFDGDGSVYHWLNKGTTLKKYSYYTLLTGERVKKLKSEDKWQYQDYAILRGECAFIACPSMIKDLSLLFTKLAIKYRFKKSQSDLMSYIIITNKSDIKKLYEYMYSNANFFMERKKIKFEEILNNIGGYSKTTPYLTR